MKKTEYGLKSAICSSAFTTTRIAQYSVLPRARLFQIMTIAMHRARPTMMTPVRYPGRSGSVAHASPSMRNGPTIQFKTRDIKRCFHSRLVWKIPGRVSYWIFVSTGHIMTMRPTAMAVGNRNQ